MGPWNPIFLPEALGTNGVLFPLCSEVSETDIRPDHVLPFEVNQKMDEQKNKRKRILARRPQCQFSPIKIIYKQSHRTTWQIDGPNTSLSFVLTLFVKKRTLSFWALGALGTFCLTPIFRNIPQGEPVHTHARSKAEQSSAVQSSAAQRQ